MPATTAISPGASSASGALRSPAAATSDATASATTTPSASPARQSARSGTLRSSPRTGRAKVRRPASPAATAAISSNASPSPNRLARPGGYPRSLASAISGPRSSVSAATTPNSTNQHSSSSDNPITGVVRPIARWSASTSSSTEGNAVSRSRSSSRSWLISAPRPARSGFTSSSRTESVASGYSSRTETAPVRSPRTSSSTIVKMASTRAASSVGAGAQPGKYPVRIVATLRGVAQMLHDPVADRYPVRARGPVADHHLAGVGGAGAGDPHVKAHAVAEGELAHHRLAPRGQHGVGVGGRDRAFQPLRHGRLPAQRLVERELELVGGPECGGARRSRAVRADHEQRGVRRCPAQAVGEDRLLGRSAVPGDEHCGGRRQQRQDEHHERPAGAIPDPPQHDGPGRHDVPPGSGRLTADSSDQSGPRASPGGPDQSPLRPLAADLPSLS